MRQKMLRAAARFAALAAKGPGNPKAVAALYQWQYWENRNVGFADHQSARYAVRATDNIRTDPHWWQTMAANAEYVSRPD